MPSTAGTAPWLLARFAQGAIAAAAVADVFRAVALRADRLDRTDASPHRSGFASMVSVYAMTAAVALFLVWFSRARRNARTLSPGAVTGSGVWAVVAWLVPVVNLWVPRRLLLDVQRGSGAGAPPKDNDDLLVNAWWAAWVGRVVFALVSQAGGSTAPAPLVVTEALNLVAAVLVLRVIQRVTARQSDAFRAFPVAPLSPA